MTSLSASSSPLGFAGAGDGKLEGAVGVPCGTGEYEDGGIGGFGVTTG